MCDDVMKVDELVAEMQANLVDIWRPEFSDSCYITNWLKARDFDLKKAELMLRNHITWRKTENIDAILEEFQIPEVFEKYGFGGYCGHDKEGRPVWYEVFGRSDPQGLLKSITTEDFLKSRIWTLENMIKNTLPERSKEQGHPVTQTLVLFDMEHLGMQHLWRPAMTCTIEATKVMEANYPESMYKLYIFNATPIFKIAFKIVKPFLHQETRKKITFLGKNFQDVLLNVIDAVQLPAYYGGNMYGPDNDPMCRHLIRWGGEVPRSYYLNNHKQEMISVTVPARSKIKLSFLINKPDSVLQYEFSTKENDVSFGIFYIGESMEHEIERIKSKYLESVFCLQRRHSNFRIQKGEVGSLRVGYYLIEFDNTYSWTKAKHVLYHIEVLDIMKK